jgi:hypothetical protein
VADPGVVALVGSLGGAALGGLISYGIAHNSNKSAKDLAEIRQKHESAESEKARDHEATLEHYKFERAAKERVYAEFVTIMNRLSINAAGNVDWIADPSTSGPTQPVDMGALNTASSSLEVVGSTIVVEAFHKWLRTFSDLVRMFMAVGFPASAQQVQGLEDQRHQAETLSNELMGLMREDLSAG